MKKIFLLAFVLFGSLLLHAQTSSLYVLTSFGGVDDYGIISVYNTSSHSLTPVYSFTQNDGIYPSGSLIKGTDGKLYGMTQQGVFNRQATTIFSFDISTNTFTKLHEFNGTDGGITTGSLLQAPNGKFYEITINGGAVGRGVIFSFDPLTKGFNVLHKFINAEGEEPHGTLLLLSNGLFYGTTYVGVAKDAGTMVSFNPSTSTYTKLANFLNKPSGQLPEYGKPLEIIISNVPGAVVANNGPLCQGQMLQLTASGGSSYSWTGPNGFSSTLQNPSINNISVAGAGNYKEQINSSNCTLTTNVDINPLPAAPV